MTDEEHENNTYETSILVHVKNAAYNMRQVMEDYQNGEIDEETYTQRIQDAAPTLADIGCDVKTEENHALMNTKPVPENAESAMYFYTDNDGNLQMTLRLFNYDDNAKVDMSSREATVAEMAGFDVLKLINQEHKLILDLVAFQQALTEVAVEDGEGEGDEETPVEENKLLEGITDPATRNQIKSFMKH